MGVITTVFRVPQTLAATLEDEPDLVDALDEAEDRSLDEIGLQERPRSVEILQYELLHFLRAIGSRALADALEAVDTLETDSGTEAQVYPAATVKTLAMEAAAIDLASTASAARDSEDIEYFREAPHIADVMAKQLANLVAFLQAASAAEEGIVVTTS